MNTFLNSFAFEQMAREYNKKYGENKIKTLTLLNDEYFEKEIIDVLDKTFCLFDLLNSTFKSNFNLKSFFEEVEYLKKEAEQTYKNLFLKDYVQNQNLYIGININHKICAGEMFLIIKNLFLIENKFIDKMFLSNQSCEQKEKDILLFKDLQKLFEKIINSFKDFYNKI